MLFNCTQFDQQRERWAKRVGRFPTSLDRANAFEDTPEMVSFIRETILLREKSHSESDEAASDENDDQN